MRYQIEIQPRDVLFFRDARPMGGSSEGAGGNWPLPSVFFSAMRSALLEKWPQGNAEFESVDHRYTDNEKNKGITALFGGLKTLGPFPQKDGVPHFPLPLDVEAGGIMQPIPLDNETESGTSPPVKPGIATNLPKPLKYAVANTRPPSKEELGDWIDLSALNRYLNGEAKIEAVRNEEVFAVESRPGVGIDPDTHANQKSIFYQAEYLRLHDDAEMLAFAECPGIKRGGDNVGDLLDVFFADSAKRSIVFGGQRGLAYMEARRDPRKIAKPETKGKLVKWVLLTPALFVNGARKDTPLHECDIKGWLPGWVDAETGRVRLKGERPARKDYRARKEWREAINNQPDIGASLVAARIGKPYVASGWRLNQDDGSGGGVPKPTRLLVPAGSVYYFECDSEKDAQALVDSLHAQVKSDLLGEQGYGFGVCASWQANNEMR